MATPLIDIISNIYIDREYPSPSPSLSREEGGPQIVLVSVSCIFRKFIKTHLQPAYLLASIVKRDSVQNFAKNLAIVWPQGQNPFVDIWTYECPHFFDTSLFKVTELDFF